MLKWGQMGDELCNVLQNLLLMTPFHRATYSYRWALMISGNGSSLLFTSFPTIYHKCKDFSYFCSEWLNPFPGSPFSMAINSDVKAQGRKDSVVTSPFQYLIAFYNRSYRRLAFPYPVYMLGECSTYNPKYFVVNWENCLLQQYCELRVSTNWPITAS